MNPIHRFRFLGLPLCLLLSACKDKGTSKSQSQAPAPESPPAAKVSEPRQASEEPAKETAEQATSTARVSVSIGALPQRSFTGAILKKDSLGFAAPAFDRSRFVVALVQGYTEEQLQDRSAQFRIARNFPGNDGELSQRGYSASLIHYDAKTGITTFSFQANLSAAADTGYHVVGANDAAKEAAPIWVDQYASGGAAGPQPRMQMFIGKSGRAGSQGAPTRPAVPDEVKLADSALLMSGSVLHGFVSGDGSSKGEVVPLDGVDLS